MVPTPMVKERRRHPRVPRSRELSVFEFQDHRERPGIARGRLADISANGAALRTQCEPPPMDACGRIVIYFEGFEFVSEARVARTWSDGFAVEFADVEPIEQNFINRLPDDSDQ